VENELKDLEKALLAAVRGMSLDELKRNREGKWSAAQILEHLCLTYQGTIKAFERCLQAEKPLGGNPTLKQRVSIAAVTRWGYLPEGRSAPERTVPRGCRRWTQSSEKQKRSMASEPAYSTTLSWDR
jgi:hypothetical protein